MADDFRVLIVDDDFHVAKLHAAYVDSVAGFLALAPVGTASLALQAIHSLRPDLVLLDVYLPDASGLDLLQKLDGRSVQVAGGTRKLETQAAPVVRFEEDWRSRLLSTITDPSHVAHGIGMKSDLAMKETELLSDVHWITLPSQGTTNAPRK